LFVWPAHGLALGLLLVTDTRRWPAFIGLTFAASVAVGYQLGVPWTRILGVAALNVAMPVFVAGGLMRLARPSADIGTVRGVAAFLVAMVPLVATMGVVQGLFSSVRLDTPLRAQWSITFVSDLVGMLLIAPLILAWTRDDWREELTFARSRMPELIAMYGGLVITAHYVFAIRPP